MRAADARTVRLHEETLTCNDGYMYEPWPGHLKLPITSLFVDKNIKCGFLVFLVRTSGTLLNQIEHIRRNFLFCNKTASSSASPFTMLIYEVA